MIFDSALLERTPTGECGPLGYQSQSADAEDALRPEKSVKWKNAALARTFCDRSGLLLESLLLARQGAGPE
jgi:hypothetical protein